MSSAVRVLVRLVVVASFGLAVGNSAEAAGRLVPVAGVNDLQNQVRTTASKVIPAVVSIASTVMHAWVRR